MTINHNPDIEGEGLGSPEFPSAPVSSALLSILWAGFGFEPRDEDIVAVLTCPENNGHPNHDTSEATLAFVRESLLTYAKNYGLTMTEQELNDIKNNLLRYLLEDVEGRFDYLTDREQSVVGNQETFDVLLQSINNQGGK
tara:strand:+ start:141 stop:560 length:420 start_codon:yes stop_codon:yes gene_type:complete